MTPAEAKAYLDEQAVGTLVEVYGRFTSGGGWGGRILIKQPDGDWHDTTSLPSPGLHGSPSERQAMMHVDPARILHVSVDVLGRLEVYS